MAEDELRRLHDQLYRLESALEDVAADLQGQPSREEYRAALAHLSDAAKDLVGTVIEAARE